MTTPSDIPADLLQLLGELADDQLTDRRREQLLEHLREDDEARAFYLDYMEVHALLEWKNISGQQGNVIIADEQQQTTDSPSVVGRLPSLSPLPSPLSPSFVGGPVFSYLVATVVLCLMLLGGWAYKISHDRGINTADSRRSTISGPHELVFVGKITGMKDCRWSNPDTGTIIGAAVALDREYALSSGLMEITYTSGAKVILEGPCTYKVDSSAGGYLAKGKLTARVETKGSGFRVQGSEHSPLSTLHSPLFAVRTPTAIVTDLGTEFGVEVAANGDTTSYVFQGSVSVQGLAASVASSIVLHETESIRVSRVRETHHDSTETETVHFTHPTTPPKFVRKISRFTKKYVYDFSRCESGNIDGQDGWFVDMVNGRPSKTNYISVVPNAAAPMSGNYVVCVGDDHKDNVLIRRINDQEWSYSIPSDADWELSALVYIGPPEAGAESIFMIHKNIDGQFDSSVSFGVGSRGTRGYNAQWRIGDSFYSALIGEEFYGVCRIGMTAKALGDKRYNVTLWYETTPGDAGSRRHFRSLGDVEADLSAFNSLTVLAASRNESEPVTPYIDNLTIHVE